MDLITYILLGLVCSAAWHDLDTGVYGSVSTYAAQCTDAEWRRFLMCRKALVHYLAYAEVPA